MKVKFLSGPNKGKIVDRDRLEADALITLGLVEEVLPPIIKQPLVPNGVWGVGNGAAGGIVVTFRCSHCNQTSIARADDAIRAFEAKKLKVWHCGIADSPSVEVINEARYLLKLEAKPSKAENVGQHDVDPVLAARRKEISEALRRWTVKLLPAADNSPIPWRQF